MAVGQMFQVRLVSQVEAQTAFNILHYRHTTSMGGDFTRSAALNQISNQFVTEYKACLSAGCTFRGIDIKKVLPVPPDVAVNSIADTGAGTAAGDLLPRAISGIITFRTAFAGRKYRGRMFVPFPSEAHNQANGLPTAGYVTLLAALATAMGTTVIVTEGGGTIVNTLQLVIRHRGDNTFDNVTALEARARWASQHRRGDYGRPNDSPF